MDFGDIIDGHPYERVDGNIDQGDVDIEWKGPFIELPDQGPAKFTVFERAEGSKVWEMMVSTVDRPQALAILDLVGCCPCCGEPEDE